MNDIAPLSDIPADKLPAPQNVVFTVMEPGEGGTDRRWAESWNWLDAKRTVFLGTRPAPGMKKRLGIWQLKKPGPGIGPKSLSIRQSADGFDILVDGEQPIDTFPTLEETVIRMLALAPGLWPDAEFAGDVAADLATSCSRLREAIGSGRTYIQQHFHVAERRPFSRDFLDVTTVFCRLFDWTGAMSDAAGRRKRKIRILSMNGGEIFAIENSRSSSQFKGTKPSDRKFKTIYGETAEDVYRRVLKHVPPFFVSRLSGHEFLELKEFIHNESELVLLGQPFLIPSIEFKSSRKI